MQPHFTFQFGIPPGKEEVITSGKEEPSGGHSQTGPEALR